MHTDNMTREQLEALDVLVLKSDVPVLVAAALLEGVEIDPDNKTDLVELVLRRQKKVHRVKDRAKSQRMKKAWRQNRNTMVKGIRRFHKSNKGKKFHKALARFNATTAAREGVAPKISDYKVALGSVKSSINITDKYICPTPELQGEWDNYHEYVNEHISEVMMKVDHGEVLSKDDQLLIFDHINEKHIVEMIEWFKSRAERTQYDEDQKEYEAFLNLYRLSIHYPAEEEK